MLDSSVVLLLLLFGWLLGGLLLMVRLERSWQAHLVRILLAIWIRRHDVARRMRVESSVGSAIVTQGTRVMLHLLCVAILAFVLNKGLRL